jgi:carbon monoxide dehydrogenase subunit G
MELSNDFEVGVPIGQAWAVLTDLERIAPCLPGAKLEEVEGDEYRGIVKVKVGPITAQYKGAAQFDDKDEAAHKAVLTASGRDTRGQGNANATITAQLTEVGGKTRVELVTDLNITGKVAQFGRGVMADISAKLLGQFVENLETTVLADDAAKRATADADLPAASDELAEPAAPQKTAKKAAKKAVKKVPAKKVPAKKVPAKKVPAKKAPAANAAMSSPPAAQDRTDEPAAPVVRKIDSPEPEPIDLVGSAGSSVLQRLIPTLVVVVVVLIVVRRLRRRRRNRP